MKLDLYFFIIWIHMPKNIWHSGYLFLDPKTGLSASGKREGGSQFSSWEASFFP